MSDILYICDRKACKRCNPECHHTTDIKHAYNFKKEYLKRDAVSFIELPDHQKDVPGDTIMDVFDTLTPKQKKCVYGLIGSIIKED